MVVFNLLGEHVASFYWWSIEWGRKSGIEDLDSFFSPLLSFYTFDGFPLIFPNIAFYQKKKKKN